MDRFWRASGGLLRAVDTVGKQLDKVETLKTSKEKFKEWTHERTATEPFHYEPLPTPTSIRLIKLEPSKKMQKAQQQGTFPDKGDASDDEDDIVFTMQTAELDRQPVFTALSYTWGRQRSALGAFTKNTMGTIKQSVTTGTAKFEAPKFDEEPAASRKVTCNGHEMRVFENLFAALKQLRRKRPDVWLWIDAICINQTDKAEIDVQMSIMGRIYRSAKFVVVWLGESSSLALRGLRYLDKMAQSGEPLPAYPLYRSKLNIGVTISEDYRIHFAALTAFHLANRSWHKRVWVVQEVCLARDITFLDGKYDIDLATLLLSCRWCLDIRGRVESGVWHTVTILLGTNIFKHMQFLPATLQAREEFSKGNKWTLLQWFHTCKGRSASKAKDFVFGGLSLIKDDCLFINQQLRASIPMPTGEADGEDHTAGNASADQTSRSSQLWHKLAPDSSASITDVFLNATACFITHEPLEGLLRLSARHRDKHRFRTTMTLRPRDVEEFSSFPSWIPAVGSWTCGLAPDLVPAETLSPFAACPPKATTSALPGVPISADGKVLSVNGAIIDTIASIEYESDEATQYDELRNLLKFLVRAKDVHAAARTGSTSGSHSEKGNQSYTMGESSGCLLEDVACAMVAGRVAGEPATPSQAGSWLCESLASMVMLHVLVAQLKLADPQEKLKALEVKAKKHGHGVEYLQTTTDKDKTVQEWRKQKEVVDDIEGLIRGIKAELDAVKSSYPQLAWPDESLVVSREKDVAAAELERESSWNKRLEELQLTRSASGGSSSIVSSFPGYNMLDRAKMSASDFVDHLNDIGYVWCSPLYERFRRVISDGCATFEHTSFDTLWWRKICLTSGGRVLLGPRWVDEGDSVVLLPGVSVPFILTRERADLEREEARTKERLEHVDAGSDSDEYVLWACYEPELRARLLQVQERLQRLADGQDEHWFLVGEAYVQGIMQGEADVSLEFNTFSLV